MKLRNRFAALFLTATMIMGMGISAMAAEEGQDSLLVINGTEAEPATVSIKKHLEFAEGITVPEADFEFQIVALTEGAPKASIEKISYSSTDNKGTLTDGVYVIHKDQEIEFGTFPHAGSYDYKITETKNTYTTGQGEKVNYSEDEYKLTVNVDNTSDQKNLYIRSITAKKDDIKQHSIHFRNIYTKTASLSVEKQVVGDYADLTKKFDFNVTFYPAANSTETEFVGKIGDQTKNFPSSGTTKVQLSHGEKLEFASLPAGTRYKVEEVGAIDGYTASVQVTENGSQGTIKEESSDGAGVTTEAVGQSSCLVGEGENTVVFTNTYQSIAVTGILMNNLPFILLIVLGICALGVLVISSKRRSVNR